MTNFGRLHDAGTGTFLRHATAEEAIASLDITADEGGTFPCDWRTDGGWNGEDYRMCYVDGADLDTVKSYAEKNRIAFSA